jgi:glycosyltransferase involved in cell wall biosynthesis
MIIAVNTRLLLPEKLEGMGRFAQETLKIITRNHPEHHFVFIFDRKYSNEFIFSDNITPVICHPQARHPLLWYWFFEWSIPPVLQKIKADLFLSPDGWLSLRTPVVSLPVIHDLNFFQFPEFIPWQVRQYYFRFFPGFVKKARRIATVSEFTRHDIVKRFDYQKDDIDVVYNGASQGFQPATMTEQQTVREKYTWGCPYFLFVGLIHPRKNLTNLIAAFDSFKQTVHSDVKLLVVGTRKWWTEEMQQALEKASFKNDIIFTGRVPESDLSGITASALAMVYVSHFEGFGIPILEAMHCDTPVITSAVTSLPEVGGDAVLYVDPFDVESIRSAMSTIYSDADLRSELIGNARKQREKFTWEKTAGLLWESVEKCLSKV